MLATDRSKSAELQVAVATRGGVRAVVDELRGSIAVLVLCLLVVVTELWRR